MFYELNKISFKTKVTQAKMSLDIWQKFGYAVGCK